MFTLKVVMLLLIVPAKFDQPLVLAMLRFCCSTNPVEGDGHETVVLVPD